MMRTLLCVAAAATLLSACDRKTEVAAPERTAGPVVSTSEAPRNDAVDTTPTTGKTAQTPGANSFTEAQSRGALKKAGYTGVTALTQDTQGLWQGKAKKGGKLMTVSIDYKGAISAK